MWKELETKKKRTFDYSEKLLEVKDILESTHHYHCIDAPFEADVRIAQSYTSVLSTDSDMLYHLIPILLVPISWKSELVVDIYVLEDVCEFWDLDKYQFQTLGIVSGNDYTKNQPGFGIFTNKKELKKLEKKSSTNEYISAYAEAIKVDPLKYEAAISIFVERKEDEIDDEQQNDYDEIKNKMATKRKAAIQKFTDTKERKFKENADARSNFLKKEDVRADLIKRLGFSKKSADNPFRSLGLKDNPRYSFKQLNESNKPNQKTNTSINQTGNPKTIKDKPNKGKSKNSQRKVANVQTDSKSIKIMSQQKIKDDGGVVQSPKPAHDSGRIRQKCELNQSELKTWKIGKNII